MVIISEGLEKYGFKKMRKFHLQSLFKVSLMHGETGY
jgi:hypothetical protein